MFDASVGPRNAARAAILRCMNAPKRPQIWLYTSPTGPKKRTIPNTRIPIASGRRRRVRASDLIVCFATLKVPMARLVAQLPRTMPIGSREVTRGSRTLFITITTLSTTCSGLRAAPVTASAHRDKSGSGVGVSPAPGQPAVESISYLPT